MEKIYKTSWEYEGKEISRIFFNQDEAEKYIKQLTDMKGGTTKNHKIEVTPYDLDTLKGLCIAHDLTYSYSDDHRVWKRGNYTIGKVINLIDYLVNNNIATKEECYNVWNSVVDTKIVEGHREQFYWKE